MASRQLQHPAAPNLPLAGADYTRQYQDQFANVLRLYFNRLNNNLLNLFGSNEGVSLASGPDEIPDPERRAKYFPRFGRAEVREVVCEGIAQAFGEHHAISLACVEAPSA